LEYAEVSPRTIAHHIKEAWQWDGRGRYFYCDDPACDIAYFGDDGTIIHKSRLRTAGAKSAAADAMLCYCFGVRRMDAERNPAIRDYVMAQTKQGLCSCDTSNPAGRCCLKDFPKVDTGGTVPTN
jgi:hypothetical protein